MPYFPTLHSLKRIIKNVDNRVSVVFNNTNTIRNKLIRNSPAIRHTTDKKGIYIIPCIDCTQVYVGETGRSLDIRVVEHKRACRLGYENSAVANHTLNIGHRINFNKAAIICQNNNISHRRVLWSIN